jgi:hypothetical protein
VNRILRGLKENQVSTDPASEDDRLVGRTYTIPFEEVWQASVALCGGELKGWSILSADDRRGVIEAVAKAALTGVEDDVRVEVQLDQNAQTRVDVWSASQKNRGTFGRNRRVIGRFLRGLDDRLEADPGQILDPTIPPTWLDS